MSLDRIDFIPSTLKFENTVEIDQPTNTGQFEKWFEQQLGEVNNQITDSGMELRKLAVGETDNLHHVMMSLEKAKLSFQFVLQVRNKILEAYQDVMRMQI